MMKIHNKSIISSFVFLAVLGAGFIMTTPVQAEQSGVVTIQRASDLPQRPANSNGSGSATGGNSNSQTGNKGNGSSNGSTAGYGQNGTTAAPVLYTTSPTYVKAGTTAATVNVIGNNFVPSSIVRIHGADRVTTYISATQLSAKLIDADTAAYGKYPITVYTPAPGGGISNTLAFVVNDGTPVASNNFYSTDTSLAYNNGATDANTDTPTPTVVGATTGTDNTNTTTTTTTTNTTKNLTANASSKSGFFPWGFLFWIFLAIAILLGVIIWRQYYLKKKEEEEKKEGGGHNMPLKHA